MKKQEFTIPVYSTEDYSIFKKLRGNRDLYPNHVKRLVTVLDKAPDFTKNNPIVVNKDMEVIDGQHRLAAFQEFSGGKNETPALYYVINENATLSSARQLNAGQKAWVPIDYALAYAEEGNKNYATYVKFSKKYRINHEILARVLSGVPLGNRTSMFRQGLFTVKNEKEADDKIRKILDVAVFYHNWPNQSFGVALIKVMESELYDQDRMLDQLSKYKEALYNVPQRTGELVQGLNMVYNWKRADKLDLLKN